MGKGGNAAAWLLAPGAMVTPFTQEILAGKKAATAEKHALADQAQAQQQALLGAQKERQRADEALNAANQKQPDVESLLAGEESAARRNAATTLLTGALGVDSKSLKLGRKTLLGG